MYETKFSLIETKKGKMPPRGIQRKLMKNRNRNLVCQKNVESGTIVFGSLCDFRFGFGEVRNRQRKQRSRILSSFTQRSHSVQAQRQRTVVTENLSEHKPFFKNPRQSSGTVTVPE